MPFDELATIRVPQVGTDPDMRECKVLPGQEIKSALNSGNVCALSKKKSNGERSGSLARSYLGPGS